MLKKSAALIVVVVGLLSATASVAWAGKPIAPKFNNVTCTYHSNGDGTYQVAAHVDDVSGGVSDFSLGGPRNTSSATYTVTLTRAKGKWQWTGTENWYFTQLTTYSILWHGNTFTGSLFPAADCTSI